MKGPIKEDYNLFIIASIPVIHSCIHTFRFIGGLYVAALFLCIYRSLSMQYPPDPYGNPGPNDQTTFYGQSTYPYQQQEQPLYESRYMNFWIKVYLNRVEFNTPGRSTQSVSVNQIVNTRLTLGEIII